MTDHTIIILSRNVDALLIPSGAPIYLTAGTEVTITQELGNTFTVNVYGNLARIDGKDADALGREIAPALVELPEGITLQDLVWERLKTCYDPEIPVNIVDLGLIYDCKITEKDNGEQHIAIKMTLTAPGCGMGPVLAEDVKQKLLALPKVKEVDVELVFDPPWDRSMMSDVAKLELGMF
ncbi:MAG TPA: putative Fe-S cluster assembly protein SufT [Gammaproteobacteria bacterium]|nr:putative Fe-S cluster assembly protein SufT [Gammaproteobacteria bacterium]